MNTINTNIMNYKNIYYKIIADNIEIWDMIYLNISSSFKNLTYFTSSFTDILIKYFFYQYCINKTHYCKLQFSYPEQNILNFIICIKLKLYAFSQLNKWYCTLSVWKIYLQLLHMIYSYMPIKI